MERGKRIELSASAWKAEVLPLYEPRINNLMKYYEPITLNNLQIIQEKVFNIFPKEMIDSKVNNLFYLPDNINLFLSISELRTELDRLGWTQHVLGFAFYVVPPNSGSMIHLDSGEIIHSFNIPIKNCKNTFVNFYKTTSQPIKRTYIAYDKEVNYFMFNPHTCELVDKLEMNTPHVIKVKEAHNITNLNTGSRITLLIRLKSNLDLSYLFE